MDTTTFVQFRTPSRSCPMRVYNGEIVRVLDVRYRKKVKRLGRVANVFLCELAPGFVAPIRFWAIEDELFIDPPDTTPARRAA
jgi:hypothetical protein